MKTLLTSMIHRKILKMSPLAKAKYTSGQLSNLAFTDPQRISGAFQYLPELVNIPVTIACCLYLLWQQLGSATITAFVSLSTLIALAVLTKKKFQASQSRLMKAKDERAKLISQMLNTIKAIKLYTWEKPIVESVAKKRDKETTTIQSQVFYMSFTDLCTSLADVMVLNITLLVYCLVNGGVINVNNAFVSLNLFTIMQQRVRMIDNISVAWAEFNVARTRLSLFFDQDEADSMDESKPDEAKHAISIKDGDFAWSETGSKTLQNIDLNVKPGSITAVIGRVGSGKSSLISAILGNMFTLKGTCVTTGDLTYVPQSSWIQNATIKKNITFTGEFDASRYGRVVSACALDEDLKILPAGDETEIGERGINLSGGQKQRVSLARAVYSNRDIYLLDDTLSAVDANVGNHLFEHVIGQNGLLRNKTRILVTHNLALLPYVDDIIIMKGGRIDFQGSYETLMQVYPNLTKDIGDQVERDEKQPEVTEKNANHSKSRLVGKEGMNSKSVMWKVFSTYVASVSWKKLSLFTLVFAAKTVLAVLASLWLGLWASDSANEESTSPTLRNSRLFVYAGLGVGQLLTGLIVTYLLLSIIADAAKALHSQMLSRILRAPMSFFDTTPTGRILNRFTSDIYNVDCTSRIASKQFSNQLLRCLSSTCLIVLKTPLALFVILIVIMINSWNQGKYLRTSRQLQRVESTTRSFVFSQFSETISGSAMIRAHDAVTLFNESCDKKLDCNNVASYCMTITRNTTKAIGGCVGSLIILASLGLVLVADLDASTAGIIFGASTTLTAAIVQGYEQYAQVESCLVAVERCQEYTTTPVEDGDESDCTELPLHWPERGTITFKSYSSKYRPELDQILTSVNLDINGGEKVGIVGRTGAGKSSISLALFRIIEATEGHIFIDDIDCKTVRLTDLRSRMCIIPQDPVLFIGSLRYNLDPFSQKSDRQLWRALEIVELKSFVSQLNGGLDHEIGEGGENISIGQRQLVCLARAVLRKSRILVLDEATAAIDNATDDQIQRTIRSEFADCTILTIAHRLNTVLDYDKILVMDKGTVAEYDKPDVLLKRTDSHFHKLARDAGLF
ncbi:Multidrug resistance-associated protein 1 [Halotydeus destructor]|nr:Multidrug resistance-associated protein 1 [Halotydeus destructor]